MAKRKQSKPGLQQFPTIEVAQVRSIRSGLLKWYTKHRRDLPWRHREGDGYAQMLSEFMLQQTQVATVIDYYERFIERFPTVDALARADVDEVLAMWAGLGYYSRARNLHAAAQQVVELHDSCVPGDIATLMQLPGIGRYTAGAIASIAYGTRAAVLDGNVSRVLMRLLAIDCDPKLPVLVKHLWVVAESLLPVKRVGDFNQAMMELGATCCTPKQPTCDVCPVARQCQALALDSVDRIPPPKQRTAVLSAAMIVVAVRQGDRLLFTQRPATGLWAKLWELPSEPCENGETHAAVLARLRKRLPAGCRVSRTPIGQTMSQLTHRRITFHVYQATAKSGVAAQNDSQPARWLSADERPTIGISRACQSVLELLDG